MAKGVTMKKILCLASASIALLTRPASVILLSHSKQCTALNEPQGGNRLVTKAENRGDHSV
jgi:hypothetical protein